MNNEMKEEYQNIEIPKELHKRVELAVSQFKKDRKKPQRFPKWIIASVASLVILGLTWTFGGSYIADATETLISQFFGSKEKFLEAYPNEKENLSGIENHLEVLKKVLSEKEFADYSRLAQEWNEIKRRMALENRKVPTSEEQKRLIEISSQTKKYEDRITDLTTHSLEEAQGMVSYPINKPTYVPEGYSLEKVEARTEESDIGKDPTVRLQYRKGEFSFYTVHDNLGSNKKDEVEKFAFKHNDSYKVRNYKLVYAYSGDTNVKGMRIEVPEKGYKISMIASLLSKEEMEKILLSMVEK